MSVTPEEIKAAVAAMHSRMGKMVTSVGNLPTLPGFLKPAVERIVTVALHDTEQLVRKALNPDHVIEPWSPPTPEEVAAAKAAELAQPSELVDDDGLAELRQSLKVK